MKQRGDETFDSQAGTRVGSPLFLWGKPSVFRNRPRKAYSLLEFLVCLLLWSALAGAILVTFLPPHLEAHRNRVALREGEHIARWIQRSLIKACIERRAFDIKYYSGRRDFMRIQWYSPPEQETYRTDGKCWIQFDTRGWVRPRYSPAWHTMTPAVTLKIYTSGDRYDPQPPVAKITVSGYCLVSFREVE
ncbi:MAG: hypothetical protein ACP5DY_03730 [Thermovirgaceae bacterium]